MADGRNQPALFVKLTHEVQHLGVLAQLCRRAPARNQQDVEGTWVYSPDSSLHDDFVAMLTAVTLGARTENGDICASLAKAIHRIPELEVLIAIFGEHRNPLAFELHHRPRSGPFKEHEQICVQRLRYQADGQKKRKRIT